MVLAAVLVLSAGIITASAQDFVTTTNNDTITIIQYIGASNAVTIPAVFNGFPVVSIGDSAFYYNASVTNIVIPDTVTNIGTSAFDTCINLLDVSFGTNLMVVGTNAFANCTSLTDISLPDSVTAILSYAFFGCADLTSFTMPDDVVTLGNGVFHGTQVTQILTSANSQNYISVGGVLFNRAQTTLELYPIARTNTSYIVPNGVTSIRDYAFEGSLVTSVIMPVGVTNVGISAFDSCYTLTNVSLPGGLLTVGDSTFSDCTSLTNLTIPDSVESIGDSSFYFCGYYSTGQPGFRIPSHLKNLGYRAFSYSPITSAIIPDTLTIISNEVFAGCAYLTNAVIASSVTSIGNDAFYSATSLHYINIPDSVTNLGAYAFDGASLTNMHLSAGISIIPSYAFAGNPFPNLSIPNGVTEIGDNAFSGCTFTNVFLPASVVLLDDGTFAYCANLKTVWAALFFPTYNYTTFHNDFGLRLLAFPSITANANLGVNSNQFSFDIAATPGMTNTVVIQACTNLAAPAWVSIGTNTFVGASSHFSDSHSTNYPKRFYRLATH